jgi:hypothetical protein
MQSKPAPHRFYRKSRNQKKSIGFQYQIQFLKFGEKQKLSCFTGLSIGFDQFLFKIQNVNEKWLIDRIFGLLLMFSGISL